MKKILTLLIITLALTVQAQNHADFVKQFKGNKDYTCVTISKAALRLMPRGNVGGMNISGLAGKLSGLTVIESNTAKAGENLLKETDKYVKKGGFEALLDVDDQGDTTEILFKESPQENVFILKHFDPSDKEAQVIIFTGTLTLQDVEAFTGGNGRQVTTPE